jgi:predicted membrane-bound dolichyl-phosphate-mannose-protein mannosyltransferase
MLLMLGLHLLAIGSPDMMMFDEYHYVPEAQSILDGGELLRWEHPPLGKLFIAAGIALFGDTPFGWRIFSALFGVAAILLFYLICRELTTGKYLPLAATSIFALENLSFVQSGIAMLDVYSVTFMMGGFLFYLRKRYVTAGVLLALAVTAKFTGGFAVLAILAHWFFKRRHEENYRAPVRFSVSALLSFLMLMPFFEFLATGRLLLPWDRVAHMLDFMSAKTMEAVYHPAACPPWEWLYLPKVFFYANDPQSYSCALSWSLWILIIPLLVYGIYRLRTDKGNQLILFALLWFASTYLLLIPMQLLSDRIMYAFYIYPTAGALSLMAGFWLSRLWPWRIGELRVGAALAIAWMSFHALNFVVFSPILWALLDT